MDESLVTLEWEKHNGHSSQTYHKVTGDEKKKRSESQKQAQYNNSTQDETKWKQGQIVTLGQLSDKDA